MTEPVITYAESEPEQSEGHRLGQFPFSLCIFYKNNLRIAFNLEKDQKLSKKY